MRFFFFLSLSLSYIDCRLALDVPFFFFFCSLLVACAVLSFILFSYISSFLFHLFKHGISFIFLFLFPFFSFLELEVWPLFIIERGGVGKKTTT